jgi:ribosomal protein L18E
MLAPLNYKKKAKADDVAMPKDDWIGQNAGELNRLLAAKNDALRSLREIDVREEGHRAPPRADVVYREQALEDARREFQASARRLKAAFVHDIAKAIDHSHKQDRTEFWKRAKKIISPFADATQGLVVVAGLLLADGRTRAATVTAGRQRWYEYLLQHLNQLTNAVTLESLIGKMLMDAEPFPPYAAADAFITHREGNRRRYEEMQRSERPRRGWRVHHHVQECDGY